MGSRPEIDDIEYVVDLHRPFTRRRRWRFGILDVRGPAPGDRQYVTLKGSGERDIVRKAEAACHHARSRGPQGPTRLYLLEARQPMTQEVVRATKELRCPEPECGRAIVRISESWEVVVPQSGKTPPIVLSWSAPGPNFPRFDGSKRTAKFLEVQTQCPRCKQRAVWAIPQRTSWVRYKRVAN